MATRVFHEIGLRLEDSDPELSDIIKNCFYMDDLIFGHYDLQYLSILKNKIKKAMESYGFNLKKWRPSNSKLIENDKMHSQEKEFLIQGEKEAKALGTVCHPSSDTIGYNFNLNIQTSCITKRTVLSTVGQLFEILGLINPVVVKAKLILQKIWNLLLDWVDEMTFMIIGLYLSI